MENIKNKNEKTNMDLSRDCQKDGFQGVETCLQTHNECIVKMFCGTGKTRIMVKLTTTQEKTLNVIVFPSLALIQQFSDDYIGHSCLKKHKKLNVSSLDVGQNKEDVHIESTTDPIKIKIFVGQKGSKIICVSYQSLNVLLDNLDGHKIGLCLFDEAHRTTSPENKKLVYDESYTSLYDKKVFFTATPVNQNGVVMFDREENAKGEYGDCGPLAFEYTYLQGVRAGILKPFDIRVVMFTERSVISIYETIARTILTTGNTRVLTFHADVSEDSKSETSVLRFVDDGSFQLAFDKILNEEFSDKKDKYKKITFRGLTGESKNKTEILKEFAETSDDEIFILSSCRTISEGIDTKNSNNCTFVDPKTSSNEIMQNIGRICRNNGDSRTATVLIPVYVDRNKYTDCGNDKVKRDLVIREGLVDRGNFIPIANVCAALKDEDPELHDIIVRYPSNFTPTERDNAIKEQKCRLDYSEENRKYEHDIVEMIEDGEPFEIHTSNLEEPIVRHNLEDSDMNNDKIYHLFQVEEDNYDGELETVYYPIVSENGKRIGELNPPKKQGRSRLDFHINDEIKMLWSIKEDDDLGKIMCSQVIECQVERIRLDPMEVAIEIVTRAQRRQFNGGKIMPRQLSMQNKKTEELKQEHKDNDKLTRWRKGLDAMDKSEQTDRNYSPPPTEVVEYLDNELPGWRDEKDDLDTRHIKVASEIVERAKQRIKKNPDANFIPRCNICQLDSEDLKQEQHDGQKLSDFIKAIKGQRGSLCNAARKILDDGLPGWSIDNSDILLENWLSNQNNLLSYMDDNNKRPSADDKKNPKNIIALGSWTQHQVNIWNEKIGWASNSETKQYEKWNEMITNDKYYSYFASNLEIWKMKFKELCEFIKKNKRIPSPNLLKDIKKLENSLKIDATLTCDKQTENKLQIQHMTIEKIIGKWRSTQIASYDGDIINSKYIMKNSDIHKLWTKFTNGEDITDEEINQAKEDIVETKIVIKNKTKSMKLAKPTQNPPQETTEQMRVRTKSELSILHQSYKNMTSVNLRKRLEDEPQLWHKYHEISEQNESSFPEDEIPRNRIIAELNKIQTKRTKHVVDMGCGKAQVSLHFKEDKRFKFTNYDHVAFDEDTVTSCDISNVSDEDNTVDIVILSLAMWGSNCHDYITEAYRILETGGILYIIEPTKRWSVKDGIFNIVEGTEAIKLRELLLEKGFKVIDERVEKFCIFRCMKP